jgi:hypothetical protein
MTRTSQLWKAHTSFAVAHRRRHHSIVYVGPECSRDRKICESSLLFEELEYSFGELTRTETFI